MKAEDGLLRARRLTPMNTNVITQDRLCSSVLTCCLHLALALALFLSVNTNAWAQQIASGISTKEAFVDSQIVFQIRIASSGSGSNDIDPPRPPKIDGLEITSAGAPSRSSSIRIVNGRRSASSTFTYNYFVMPKREGTFTLPSIDVTVGGKELSTEPHTFVVTQSETGDLLFVEVESKTKQAYVGEAVKLKLKIWLRGYSDRKQQLQLSEQHMWKAVSLTRTEWGIFGERLNQLAAQRQRPAGQDVLRKDSEGVSRAYLLYEIESTMYPKRPGPIDPGNVRIVVDYPTKIGRPRSSFGGSIFGPSLLDEMMGNSNPVQATRPISAEATASAIQVVDVPSKGRPADYRGAVGKYKLLVEADTKRLKVGEPIGLRVYIQGDGPMEFVEAPPLGTLEELTKDFRVEDKSLAGFVKGDAKVFATSIRPRSENVTEIPPIPFSFFDPEDRAFHTVNSARIPIVVDPNESLSMDSIVANKKQPKTRPDDSAKERTTSDDTGIRGVDEMLRVASDNSATNSWLPFAIAPLLCIVTFGGLAFSRGVEMPRLWRRKTNPRVLAVAAVERADTASEIRDALETHGIDLTAAVHEVREECDRLTFSPGTARLNRSVEALKQKALAALNSQAVLWIGIACLLLFSDVTRASEYEPTLSLSESQAETILREAYDLQLAATKRIETDPAAAKSQLSMAIDKYRLVSASGTNSAALQLNLGDAYLLDGALVPALAAFEAANRLQTSAEIRQRIASVREKLGDKLERDDTFWQYVRSIPNSVWWWLGLISWSLFWALAIVFFFVVPKQRVFVFGAAFSLLSVSALLFAGIQWANIPPFQALAAVDGLELRSADGEAFDVQHVVRLGEPLIIDDQRGGWLHVSTTAAQEHGWLKAEDVVVVAHR